MRVQKCLLIVVALCLAGLSAWVVLTPPARSFEVIYDVFPLSFWMLFSAGLVATALVFLFSSMTGDEYWKVGLVGLCFLLLLYSTLPAFRGWAMYGRNSADVLAHIGIAKTILRTNRVPGDDIYPVVHLLVVELRYLGLPMRTIPLVLAAFFNCVYVLGIYVFVRRFARNHRLALTALVCALPFLYSKYHVSFLPSIFSFMLFPLVLFLVVNYRTGERASYTLLALLVSAVFVAFHPVTSLYVVLALFVSIGAQLAYAYVTRSSSADRSPDSSDTDPGGSRSIAIADGTSSIVGSGDALKREAALLVFVSAVWALWYASFPLVWYYIGTALDVSGSSRSTVASEYGAQMIARAQSTTQLLVGFVNSYGPIFLVCGLAAVASLLVAVRFWRKTATGEEIWLTSQFSAGAGVSVVTIVTYVVAFNPVRNSRYMILMATVLAGLLLYWLLHRTVFTRQHHQWIAVLVVVILLLGAIPITVMNTYQPNQHMTFSEREGTDWFYDHRATELAAVSHEVTYKMRMFLQGGTHDGPVFAGIGPDSPVPRYLGYRTNETLGRTVNASTYLVTKEYDTEFYQTLKGFNRKRAMVYTEESKRKLRTDPTVDQIYSNGGYAVWYVHRSAGTAENESKEARNDTKRAKVDDWGNETQRTEGNESRPERGTPVRITAIGPHWSSTSN